MDRESVQRRAEVAMWGCFACAQPWFVVGSRWALAWAFGGAVSWLVAKLAGSLDNQTDFVQRAVRWLTGWR